MRKLGFDPRGSDAELFTTGDEPEGVAGSWEPDGLHPELSTRHELHAVTCEGPSLFAR